VALGSRDLARGVAGSAAGRTHRGDIEAIIDAIPGE
jgi:hypothetical protein